MTNSVNASHFSWVVKSCCARSVNVLWMWHVIGLSIIYWIPMHAVPHLCGLSVDNIDMMRSTPVRSEYFQIVTYSTKICLG